MSSAAGKGRNVPENETILYRGASYELGHGSGFYGIWPANSPRPESIEWWPDTPDGWQGAWARYNTLEVPGSIAMVGSLQGPPRRPSRLGIGHLGTRGLLAAGLLAAGIICGLAGLFPSYLAGSSLSSSASQVIPHIFYLVGWTASLVLILLGGARLKAGVLLSLGLSIVTFGFFFSDAGQVIAGGSHLMGAGLALSLIGWVACAAGSVVALPFGAGVFRRSVAELRGTFSPAQPAPGAQPALGAPGAQPAPGAQVAPGFPPEPAAQSEAAAQPQPSALTSPAPSATETTPDTEASSPSAAPQAPEVPVARSESSEDSELSDDPESKPATAEPVTAEPATGEATREPVPAGVAATSAPPNWGTSDVPQPPAATYSPYGPYTSYGTYQPARTSRWSNPVTRRIVLALTLAVLAAIGAAITFAPSWDSYTLRTAAGGVHSLTAGNAFDNPGAVIAGDVLVMVALVVVAALAAVWRPIRLGAVLLAGALIPMVAQAVSALAQLGEGVSSAQFGISSAQAQQLGLSISQGLTAWFWFYCLFVVVLAVICGWMWSAPRRTSQAMAPAAVGTYT
jgi:hypothetical protein